MTLGEKFKQLRMEKGLSQPELAEIAGIEQSYLSKLENDKSLPSNEVFRKMLSAFSVSVEQILHGLEQSYIKANLMMIADIEQFVKQLQANKLAKQRNLLYSASAFIVLAVTLFYIGFSKQVFNETLYEYKSKGVVLAGEPNDVFSRWSNLIDSKDRNVRDELRRKKLIEMTARSDEQIIHIQENLGQLFVKEVDGGKRLYRKEHSLQKPRAINAWLQVVGVFLFVSGLMLFVVERRLYK